MKLTKQLKIFIALTSIYTIPMIPLIKIGWSRQGLTNGTSDFQVGPNIVDAQVGMLLFILLLTTAVILLKRENSRASRKNLPLTYHLYATVVTIISSLAFWAFIDLFNYRYVLWVLFFGAASLSIHWAKSRKTIKGIDSEDAFK